MNRLRQLLLMIILFCLAGCKKEYQSKTDTIKIDSRIIARESCMAAHKYASEVNYKTHSKPDIVDLLEKSYQNNFLELAKVIISEGASSIRLYVNDDTKSWNDFLAGINSSGEKAGILTIVEVVVDGKSIYAIYGDSIPGNIVSDKDVERLFPGKSGLMLTLDYPKTINVTPSTKQ